MSLQTQVTVALVVLSIEYALASGTRLHKFPVHSHYSFSGLSLLFLEKFC